MNIIYKSLAFGGNVALSVIDSTELVQEAIDIHNLSGGEAELFGKLLTFAAYLGGTLKSERGSVSVTVKSTEGGSVSVSCDSALHVRGCIDGKVENILDGGTLTVISEDGYSRPFVGTCLLEGGDINKNLENYFRQSEQVVTFVNVGCKVEGGKCLSAGGAVGACLPDSPFAEVEKFRVSVQGIADISQKIREAGAENFSAENFGGEKLSTLFPIYKCNCSREKISQVLKAVGKEDLLSLIAERGMVSVHCHYCNKDYNFYEDDIKTLF